MKNKVTSFQGPSHETMKQMGKIWKVSGSKLIYANLSIALKHKSQVTRFTVALKMGNNVTRVRLCNWLKFSFELCRKQIKKWRIANVW